MTNLSVSIQPPVSKQQFLCSLASLMFSKHRVCDAGVHDSTCSTYLHFFNVFILHFKFGKLKVNLSFFNKKKMHLPECCLQAPVGGRKCTQIQFGVNSVYPHCRFQLSSHFLQLVTPTSLHSEPDLQIHPSDPIPLERLSTPPLVCI